MTFNPNIPQPTNLLEDSQGDLLSNNLALDATFGIDHYKFSSVPNNGFHNKVTSPQFVTTPVATLPSVTPTTTTAPIFYAYTPLDIGGLPITNLPVMHYSKGVSNAVPTPLTSLQSAAGGVSLNAASTLSVFDFAGILTPCFCTLMYSDATVTGVRAMYYIFWSGTPANTFALDSVAVHGVTTIASGTSILINNPGATNYTAFYWTLKFFRN